MSKRRIQQQAMYLFATHGYEGASMQLVAEAVGIKKQSIYTHYRNKDALFLAACEQAMAQELAYAIRAIDQMETIDALEGYLYTTASRYDTQLDTRFWLRMSIYPPQHLQTLVMAYVYTYLDEIEEALRRLLRRTSLMWNTSLDETVIAQAYLSILDACHIELLYGGATRVQKRMAASWTIFKRGVQ